MRLIVNHFNDPQTAQIPLTELHGSSAGQSPSYDQADLLFRLSTTLESLHTSGQYLRAACPNCGGSDRFYTGPKVEYAHWHCHSCDHKASTRSLLGETLGSSFVINPRPSVKEWKAPIDEAGNHIDEIQHLYTNLATFSHRVLLDQPQALAYLSNRGVDLDIVKTERLGFLDSQWYHHWYEHELTSRQRAYVAHAGLPEPKPSQPMRGFGSMFAGGFKGKIVFPYYDLNGTVQDLRTRSISPKDSYTNSNGKRVDVRYTSPKHAPDKRGVCIPYGVNGTLDNRIVLTEGEFKRLVPLSAGATVPIIALRGTSDLQDAYLDHFRGKLVVLAFDSDEAGTTANITIGRKLQAHGIAVAVVQQQWFCKQKGIDDLVNAFGVDSFNNLIDPGNTLTLHEYEQQASRNGLDLSKLKTPKADIGTVRQWRPADLVDRIEYLPEETITADQAAAWIAQVTSQHWLNWHRGHAQLLITAGAGTGKTTMTMQTAIDHAQANDQTVAVFLPTHRIIDEKIDDGTLPNFRHIYGRNSENCQQSDKAQALAAKGYQVPQILCANCPFKDWCNEEGYYEQYQGKENRAYTHGHLFSHYAEGEDLVVIDELTHKSFIQEVYVHLPDIHRTLESHTLGKATRELLEGIAQLYATPDLGTVEGLSLYELVERFYPDLRQVDRWDQAQLLQQTLDGIAKESVEGGLDVKSLPYQFGDKLITLLSEDVQRINTGQDVTGRVSFVNTGASQFIKLTYRKRSTGSNYDGALGRWFVGRPTVILNATADAQTMQHLLGEMTILAPTVQQNAGNEILQDITRNNAKSGLVGQGETAQKQQAAWLNTIQQHIENHAQGEADTTIITVKPLYELVATTFPTAKVAYYGNLEGSNELESGLTILANPPSVNLDAVQREAAALFPGSDLTLTRETVAFDYQNASGEYLTIEQVSAVDPRVQAILEQHRDAMTIQAIQRARLTRRTGRNVVVMFARPIPGLAPTQIIHERTSAPSKTTAANTQATLDRILLAAQQLREEQPAFTVGMLANEAQAAKKTIDKYWEQVTNTLGMNSYQLPVIRPVGNKGGMHETGLRVAINSHLIESLESEQPFWTSLEPHLTHCLPEGWQIDPKADENHKMYAVSTPYNNNTIDIGNSIHLDGRMANEPPNLNDFIIYGQNAPPIQLTPSTEFDRKSAFPRVLQPFIYWPCTKEEVERANLLAQQHRIALVWGHEPNFGVYRIQLGV